MARPFLTFYDVVVVATRTLPPPHAEPPLGSLQPRSLASDKKHSFFFAKVFIIIYYIPVDGWIYILYYIIHDVVGRCLFDRHVPRELVVCALSPFPQRSLPLAGRTEWRAEAEAASTRQPGEPRP